MLLNILKYTGQSAQQSSSWAKTSEVRETWRVISVTKRSKLLQIQCVAVEHIFLVLFLCCELGSLLSVLGGDGNWCFFFPLLFKVSWY